MSDNTNITLTPSFIIYVNGTRFSVDQETDVKEVIISEKVDSPSTFEITMADEERKWTDNQDLGPGSIFKIMLGYKDAVEELISGEVISIIPGYRRGADDQVTFKGSCHLHRLKGAIKTRSFNEMTDAEIVQMIADEAGLASEVGTFGASHFFTVQKDLSDYEYLLQMAKKNNCRMWSKDGTLFFKKDQANSGEDVILEWGKTLMDFHPKLNTQELITEVEVRGWDHASGSAIVETAGLSDIELKIGGNILGGSIVEESFNTKKMTFVDEKITDQNSALTKAIDLITTNSMRYITARGKCQGNTKLKAGAVLEVKELAETFSGKYYITDVEHRFVSTRGYNTWFELVRNAKS